MRALLLTEPVALSQAPGFLGLGFITYLKLVLEAYGLVHWRSPQLGSRGPVGAKHLAECSERGQQPSWGAQFGDISSWAVFSEG